MERNLGLVELVLSEGANAHYRDYLVSDLPALLSSPSAVDVVKCYIVIIQAASIQALLSTCRHHCLPGTFLFCFACLVVCNASTEQPTRILLGTLCVFRACQCFQLRHNMVAQVLWSSCYARGLMWTAATNM